MSMNGVQSDTCNEALTMGITFSSDCKVNFEPETESYEPKRRARGRGRPRKVAAEGEELKSSVRSKPVNYEDLEDED
jgi:hypothetical protein